MLRSQIITPPLRLFCAGVSWGRVWARAAIINLWPCPGIVVKQSETALCELVCLPNCTLLAGFRVLLVQLLLAT